MPRKSHSRQRVIAVGPGGVVDGKEVKMQVSVGDKVIYSKYAGTEVKLGDDEFIVVRRMILLQLLRTSYS